MTDPLSALEAAVQALPDDRTLRVRYAELLADAGRHGEAIEQASVVLREAPEDEAATAVVRRAALAAAAPPEPAVAPPTPAPSDRHEDIDWSELEASIANPTEPPFVERVVTEYDEELVAEAAETAEDADPVAELRRETVRLADVGGLEVVKRRIDESFLQPMAHPEIAAAFGKKLRGGLLLYGPPGCGKTFLARAIAGELGAHFISVTLSDVLDRFIGESEKNIHRVFRTAREHAPAVLFFDEMDAIGAKRSGNTFSSFRNVVNQILVEMDGVDSQNDGVYVLAATNHPWEVDAALKRPGRFDRMVLVRPPDDDAREAILRVHLRRRPIEGIDLGDLVRRTKGFSGADLEHLVTTAAEKAMTESIRTGSVRPMRMDDMRAALKEVKPSIGPWVQTARNVAEYSNGSGEYDDMVEWLREEKQL
jgi:SpoVK/Ycf46/Vps4 family AAA+-type ATPase